MKPLLLLLCFLLILSGCSNPPSNGTGQPQQSQVRVLLTDAPADEASSLLVTFTEVRLVPEGEEEAGIVTITESGGTLDVLDLRNGRTAVLGERSVPSGTYTQLRLIVESAEITFAEGEGEVSYEVKIPSGEQSGLKINVEPALVAQGDEVSEILLDFDARNAIRETPPGSGNYLLRPTAVRAVTQTGVLSGRVVDAGGEEVEGALVTVWSGELEVTTARTEGDGSFRIISLTAGTYDVEVGAEGYGVVRLEDVSITTGETTGLETIALALP